MPLPMLVIVILVPPDAWCFWCSRSARSGAGSATSSTGRRTSRSRAWATGTSLPLPLAQRGSVESGRVRAAHRCHLRHARPLRPEAVAALRGAEHIIHAGDIGAPDLLTALAAIAPVTAVRGNNDRGRWAASIPETAVLAAGGTSIYVIHDVTSWTWIGGGCFASSWPAIPIDRHRPGATVCCSSTRQRGTAAFPPPDSPWAAARRRRRRRGLGVASSGAS